MSEQDGRQASTLQRPPTSDPKAWEVYWEAQGQSWRSQPEIDGERQKHLTERRSVKPDIEQGIYPFKAIKLNRADVEWLLATHENGRGPVDWSNERDLRERRGIDLRGADLRGVDLSGLPLTCIEGGLEVTEPATDEQRNMAAVRLEKANLNGAQLQGAGLSWAQLQGAGLVWAQLQGAHLRWAQLQGAHLYWAKLQGANLRETQLQGADLPGAELDGVRLNEATLSDEKYGPARLADIRWGEVNLAVVDWTPVKMPGEEHRAHLSKAVDDYRVAVRANRQLAVILRDQGLNEEADRFAYRAQVLQRQVWRRQHRYLKYLGSWFLWLLAGHGYRPFRSVLWYLGIILGFALAYYTFGHLSLWPPDAFVYSLTSFHGRGFFPGLEGKHSLHDPLIMLAAFEAVIGLFIEISFIATFTQRFFGR
jgi:uncharacterized protein YjbI with pentapeptide repeats